MACPCCTFYYCHHDPCSKHGLLKVDWADFSVTRPVSRQPGLTEWFFFRNDTSCTFPPGSLNTIIYTGMYGARLTLMIGRPVVGLQESRLAFPPVCTESTTVADDFSVSGTISVALSYALSGPGTGFYGGFFVPWNYTITKATSTIVKGVEDYADILQPNIGLGPLPNTCNDFIRRLDALRLEQPAISLVPTGPGTRCLTTALSRGFPAISGPHQNAAECEAVCGGPLP